MNTCACGVTAGRLQCRHLFLGALGGVLFGVDLGLALADLGLGQIRFVPEPSGDLEIVDDDEDEEASGSCGDADEYPGHIVPAMVAPA